MSTAADLARRVADSRPLLSELTLEKAVVADRRLLVAICCMSQWSAEQIVATYRIDMAECMRHRLRLDRLGIIELRPLNRYRLRVKAIENVPAEGKAGGDRREPRQLRRRAGHHGGLPAAGTLHHGPPHLPLVQHALRVPCQPRDSDRFTTGGPGNFPDGRAGFTLSS